MRHKALRALLADILGRTALASAALGVVAIAAPAHSQIAIVDVDSYANAMRALKMIDQQVRQLQNEAQMLLRMDKQLDRIAFPEATSLLDKLDQIDRLIARAQTVNFQVMGLEDKLRTLYPTDFGQPVPRDQRLASARARLAASNDAFRRTMLVQSQIIEQIRDDAGTLSAAMARSQGAEGSLAAQQATNQLLALTAKQQMQLQQLMATQFRSDALEQQRQRTQADEARATTKKFLGTGSAYTPR